MNKNNTHSFAEQVDPPPATSQPSLLAVIEDHSVLAQLATVADAFALPVTRMAGMPDALGALQTQAFSHILLRIDNAQAALGQLRDAGYRGRIILLLTESETPPAAVALGLTEMLRLPLDAASLLQLGVRAAPPTLAVHAGIEGVIGASPAMRRLCDMIRTIAPMPSTVLIEGESGTGKEIAARSLHRLSQRKEQPFVAINCGAISAELIESELFGHVKGAFTGAWQAHDGLFLEAHNGTLFLDEIGEMPLPAQAKLLRVLEERRLRRVGAEQEVPVDVRVIAATNRDLQEEVRAGRFRADLYYRLHVVTLTIPPLRHRLEDIPVLAGHFCQVLSKELNIPVKEPEAETMLRLRRYAFPGNVRELRNIMMRWLIFGASAFDMLVERPASHGQLEGDARESAHATAGLTLDEVERRHILQTLAQTGGNKTQAARRLGISRRTLERKCARWGV